MKVCEKGTSLTARRIPPSAEFEPGTASAECQRISGYETEALSDLDGWVDDAILRPFQQYFSHIRTMFG